MKNILQDLFITAKTLTPTNDISYIMRGDDDNYYIILEVDNFNVEDEQTINLLKKQKIRSQIIFIESDNKEKEVLKPAHDFYAMSDLIDEVNKKISIDNIGKNKKYYLILKSDCEKKIKQEFLNILVVMQKYQSKCIDGSDVLMFMPFEDKINKPEARNDIGSNKGHRFTQSNGQSFYFESNSQDQQVWINVISYSEPYQKQYAKVLLNTLNLSFFSNSSDDNERTPYISVISKDKSSDGFIDTISYGLKQKKKYEVIVKKYNINNESQHCINPFDISFGHDKPLGNELSAIISVLSYITGNELNAGALWRIAEGLYKEKYVNIESVPEIKIALLEAGESRNEMSWIEIRNIIADSGKNEYWAWYAHKQAMPTMKDFRDALDTERRGELSVFEKEFQRAIIKADEILRNNVFASSATNVNIDYREHITHLALAKDSKEAEFGYVLASCHLLKQFILEHYFYDDISSINEKCKPLIRRYISKVKNSNKRIVLDDAEIAFSKKHNRDELRGIITVLLREGRKQGVDLTVLFNDSICDDYKLEQLKQYSTSSFNIVSKNKSNLFMQSNIQQNTIGIEGHFSTKNGDMSLPLNFNLSPIQYWAVTPIKSEVEIRNKLYSLTSVEQARKILSKAYPAGLLMSQYNEEYNESEVLDYLLKFV